MQIFNDLYPGNLSVMEGLIDAIRNEGVTAFTGAGTSMPELPSWSSLITLLVNGAHEAGLIEDSIKNTLAEEKSDFLYVIDEIYRSAGETQTKIKVAEIFRDLKSCNTSHKTIVSAAFKKLLTLNYDLGLEMAYASQLSSHVTSITTNNRAELHAWFSRSGKDVSHPILHWHGIASDAAGIILSGSDYISFYETDVANKDTLREFFRHQRCVLIGFGFSDPFIVNQLNSVMQPLPVANRHFAIIGVPSDGTFNCALERRKYITKYKLEAIFYPISNEGRHDALQAVLSALQEKCPRSDVGCSNDIALTPIIKSKADEVSSHRTNLFEIGDRKIYCEPNLWIQETGTNKGESRITVSDLVSAQYNALISAPHEFGLTNLGHRLTAEIRLSGSFAIFRDADKLPNYHRKIVQDEDLSKFLGGESLTIVIDNFSPIDHRRLLKELLKALPRARIITLQKSALGSDISDDDAGLSFRAIRLNGLTRSDVRTVIDAISPGWSVDSTTTAVDKIYKDLLQLCIPLTPSNVIMYGSVLCKDGNFIPVSRLHIVERFIAEALQRASDAFSESFNYINKIDVFSSFCYRLFSENKVIFNNFDWNTFCVAYKRENLVDFDQVELIGDLTGGKIIARYGESYYFKYRMFFSYFVGRWISGSPQLLADCLRDGRHLEVDGLIEVLCGNLPDCSDVITNITEKLERSFAAFYEKYPLTGLDIHEDAKWEITSQEDMVWDNISKRIEEGPAGTNDLDELKSSLAAERRTDNQKISIIKFIVSEKSVSITAYRLRVALENAKNVRADVKLAAVDAVIRSYTLTYEVATIFAPLIAERKYVYWNGFTYINLIEDDRSGSSEQSRVRMLSLVCSALPTSIADNASEALGSRKLGQVFLAISKHPNKPAIYRFLNLSLLLRSKPFGWLEIAKNMVSDMGKDELYLRHYLATAMRQLRTEINTGKEVAQLKEFIATIRLRRDRNVKSANNASIRKAISVLDDKKYFDEANEQPEDNQP